MGNIYIVRFVMIFLAIVTALIFSALNLPLPWMLGPMLSTVVLKIKYPDKVYIPIVLRNIFLIPLGYNIGANITSDAITEIMNQFAGISIATLFSVAVSLVLAWWTVKMTGVSMASSTVGNMPGGLTPMLLICENIPKADVNVVAVLQSMRLMGTIIVVPFLVSHGLGAVVGDNAMPIVINEIMMVSVPVWQLAAVAILGAVIGNIIKLPAQYLLGPIITTGIFSIYLGGHLPEAHNWLISIAQIFTGIYLGTCIDPFQLGKNRKLLPVSIVGVLVMNASCLLAGYFLSGYFGFSVTTAFLACAPGGITEMCITGMVLGENVAVILSYQLFRMMFLNFVMPPAIQWYFSKEVS